jgi:hypothetical protein
MEKQIRWGAHRRAAELETAILDYLTLHNEDPEPIVMKTAYQILDNGARSRRRTLDSAH